MNSSPRTTATVTCTCGQVTVNAVGVPIASVVCYCDDCQEGGRQLQSLPDAAAVQDPDGGTGYLVYRKDRVTCVQGSALLKPRKIRNDSATNRVIASCCNSAMFLNFDDARHWVDLYRSRCRGDVPPVQMRVGTKFKAPGTTLPTDVPHYPRFAPSFLMKLLVAKVAMLLHR
jgi:hypothetical protein